MSGSFTGIIIVMKNTNSWDISYEISKMKAQQIREKWVILMYLAHFILLNQNSVN